MNRKFSMLLAVLFLLPLSFATTGCKKKTVVVNAPQGTDAAQVANWYKATGAFSQVADLVQQAEQTLRQANQTKTADGTSILQDGEYYQKLLRTFGQIAITQRSAAEYLKTVPNTFGATTQARVDGYAKAIQGFVQDLVTSGVAGIKDKTMQDAVNNLITEIGAAVQFVLTFASERVEPGPLLDVQVFAKLKEVCVVQ